MNVKDMKAQILRQIVRDFYDVRIMSNLVRPHYVERMVIAALGDSWRLVSADWAERDIESPDGVRIEVKQSSARQTWSDRQTPGGRPMRGAFDIAPRTGYWAEGGAQWLAGAGRPAHLYVFAWHPVYELEDADHGDPNQWSFFVVPERDLPVGQKTISLFTLTRRCPRVGFERLRVTVAQAVMALRDRDGAVTNH